MNRPHCPPREILIQYFLGTLPASEQDIIQHIEGCEHCLEDFDELVDASPETIRELELHAIQQRAATIEAEHSPSELLALLEEEESLFTVQETAFTMEAAELIDVDSEDVQPEPTLDLPEEDLEELGLKPKNKKPLYWAFLGAGSTAAVVVMFLIFMGDSIFIPGMEVKYKSKGNSGISKVSGKSNLSKAQQNKANALLMGNGEDAGRIRQEKKRKRKLRRRRSSVASNTPFRERPVKVRKASKEDLFANDLLNRVGARLGRKGLSRPKPGANKDPQYELKLQLSKAINRKNASIKYCYEQYLKQVTKGGHLVLRLTIQPDGSVSNVYVIRKTFRGGRMKKCILRRIQRWQFRRFKGKPVKLEIPYTFKALF